MGQKIHNKLFTVNARVLLIRCTARQPLSAALLIQFFCRVHKSSRITRQYIATIACFCSYFFFFFPIPFTLSHNPPSLPPPPPPSFPFSLFNRCQLRLEHVRLRYTVELMKQIVIAWIDWLKIMQDALVA